VDGKEEKPDEAEDPGRGWAVPERHRARRRYELMMSYTLKLDVFGCARGERTAGAPMALLSATQ
jgi:hypothetical protein